MADTIDPERIYRERFETFLRHTDQKIRALEWLDNLVRQLPDRGTLIDVGAGNGDTVSRLATHFRKTIAIEPNQTLADEIRRRCPRAMILTETLETASIPDRGDLIVCSHVLTHIPPVQWMPQVEKMVQWLTPGGSLAILLQNANCDCKQMVRHFFRTTRPDLVALARALNTAWSMSPSVRIDSLRIETIPSTITPTTFEDAYRIAEFMLNMQPLPDGTIREPLAEYVRTFFAKSESGFRFSCDQDVLLIRTVQS